MPMIPTGLARGMATLDMHSALVQAGLSLLGQLPARAPDASAGRSRPADRDSQTGAQCHAVRRAPQSRSTSAGAWSAPRCGGISGTIIPGNGSPRTRIYNNRESSVWRSMELVYREPEACCCCGRSMSAPMMISCMSKMSCCRSASIGKAGACRSSSSISSGRRRSGPCPRGIFRINPGPDKRVVMYSLRKQPAHDQTRRSLASGPERQQARTTGGSPPWLWLQRRGSHQPGALSCAGLAGRRNSSRPTRPFPCEANPFGGYQWFGLEERNAETRLAGARGSSPHPQCLSRRCLGSARHCRRRIWR